MGSGFAPGLECADEFEDEEELLSLPSERSWRLLSADLLEWLDLLLTEPLR